MSVSKEFLDELFGGPELVPVGGPKTARSQSRPLTDEPASASPDVRHVERHAPPEDDLSGLFPEEPPAPTVTPKAEPATPFPESLDGLAADLPTEVRGAFHALVMVVRRHVNGSDR